MTTLAELDPVIQTCILRLAKNLSYSELGAQFQISKQAAQKRVQRGMAFLTTFRAEASGDDRAKDEEIERLKSLVRALRIRLVLFAALVFMLKAFKSRVAEVFPGFQLSRLKPDEKKRIIDLWEKFERLGGSLKIFALTIGRGPKTIRAWVEAYQKYGMSGLHDKTSRPKRFGNKLPLWVRDQLIALFLKFPNWSPYQYQKYIRANPTINAFVSLPTITALKEHHRERTQAEKDRQRKLWCFAPGTTAWTVDFTSILKTDHYKLQLLTVSDHRSRFAFDTALFLDTSTEQVLTHLEELFIKYGKPMIIKADNGPEFRMTCRNDLRELGVYLLNSPEYYASFNGAHERIHRELKSYISNFSEHRNLERLVGEVARYRDDHNYNWTYDNLDGKTPAQIFYNEPNFVPKEREIITPYEKDGELRMKFTGRSGQPARITMPLIPNQGSIT